MSTDREDKIKQAMERVRDASAKLKAAKDALEDVESTWEVEDGIKLYTGSGFTCNFQVTNKGTRLSFFRDDMYEGIGPEQARQLAEQLTHWAETGKFKEVS